MGTVMTGPAAGNALFFDDAATMEVELLAEGMVLTGASDDALLRGAHLCLAGDELLQFGREIGRAHVWTPVTNAHLVCRLLLGRNRKSNSMTTRTQWTTSR